MNQQKQFLSVAFGPLITCAIAKTQKSKWAAPDRTTELPFLPVCPGIERKQDLPTPHKTQRYFWFLLPMPQIRNKKYIHFV